MEHRQPDQELFYTVTVTIGSQTVLQINDVPGKNGGEAKNRVDEKLVFQAIKQDGPTALTEADYYLDERDPALHGVPRG